MYLLPLPILAACGTVADGDPDGAPQVDAVPADAAVDAAGCVETSAVAARWRGDGDTADDRGLHPGTAAGGVAYGPGRHGMAFVLDGVDDLVRADAADALWPTGSFSVEAWVRMAAPPADYATVVLKYDCGGGVDPCAPSYWALFVDDGGHPMFEFRTIAGGFRRVTASTEVLTDGAWHHLVGVRDVAAGSQVLYVDGTAAVSAAITGDALLALANGDGGSDPVTIGAQLDSTGALIYYLAGAVDGAALYTTALAPPVVAALHGSEVGPCR